MENDLADALTRLADLSPRERASVLLAPLEQAASSAPTMEAAHDAFVRVVCDIYAPAVRQAHRRSGREVAEILDELARTLGAGRVRPGLLGIPEFVATDATRDALRSFMEGLIDEVCRRDAVHLSFASS